MHQCPFHYLECCFDSIRLLQYVEEQGLTISGNAYEERLIDEIGALDKERQIIQVSIAVSP